MRVSNSASDLASTVMAQPGCTFSVSWTLPRRVAQYRPALEIQTPQRGCLARASVKASSIAAIGTPFLLQVPTMTGKRASFQGFRGTPMDECPPHDQRCPQRDLRCPCANDSGYHRPVRMYTKTPAQGLPSI